jgi:N-acetylglucosamine-6-phosphate deacetylase
MTRQVITGAAIFDGWTMRHDHALVIEDGLIAAIIPTADAPDAARFDLKGGTLAPGLIDLQVNGGAGMMVDGALDLARLSQMCAVHADLGATGILPTLITDTPAATKAVIAAGIAAARVNIPGFLGLHLEGPHLDPRRQGAHDPALIRPMGNPDIDQICDAAAQLPALMVTLAPAAATPAQITRLTRAGVVVSLGHAECTYDQAIAAIDAGARCVTHLFNAMTQLGNREPGLVGAVLAGDVHAGVIADGLHVHPATLRIALAARDTGLFLVSDSMAVAGTDLTRFTLGERQILRKDGCLTLPDGTLAGADLSLPRAIAYLIRILAIAPERALAMASRIPADLIRSGAGRIAPGLPADLVHFDQDWTLQTVWKQGGVLVR